MTTASTSPDARLSPSLAASVVNLDIGARPTSMAALRAVIDSRPVRIELKLESDNRWGSIKDRTAMALVKSVARQMEHRDAVLVESTSGNLGVALAEIASALDRRFIAVVDPNISPVLAARLTDTGAELDYVSQPDQQGGFLDARLRRVAELLRQMPEAVWTNQYHNPANPMAHYRGTAPQLLRQAPDVDAVFVAVSTGGTLTGVSRYLRLHRPHARVIAVDVPASRIFGEPTGRRLLTGIGASRPSEFLRPGDWDDVVLVDDDDAIAVCHALKCRTGWELGGSSGAVVAACLQYLRHHPHLQAPVCVCADGGTSYRATLYDDDWLAERGLAPRAWPARLHGIDLPEQDLNRTRRAE